MLIQLRQVYLVMVFITLRNSSVSVVDFDGKPLANQKVCNGYYAYYFLSKVDIFGHLAPEIGLPSPES